MVFSSTIFLFAFLPAVLAVYVLSPRAIRNLWLLLASLFFYAWGEAWFVLVMLVSVVANYAVGLGIDCSKRARTRKVLVAAGIAANVGLLGSYKYASFVVQNLDPILQSLGARPIDLAPIHLPIGISFFTFQAMSYVIDVYRRETSAQRNPLNVALYIALFPQLIAGPIVRYAQIADELVKRQLSRGGFALGVRRFIVGLAKKVLIANTLALPADKVFAIPPQELTTGLAWFGALCYTGQIFYDFSGYSDMAIGLGRMFGFYFPENFNYPYMSQSIREFWRRWHISLSAWFRDYLYIPLGGNRHSTTRTYLNLITVFFLCGLWHGASWTFVIWGMYHGVFLSLERTRFGEWTAQAWRPARHAYACLVVIAGWVLFRADTVSHASSVLQAMAGRAAGDGIQYHLGLYLAPEVGLALVGGAIASTPVIPALSAWAHRAIAGRQDALGRALNLGASLLMVGLLLLLLVVSVTWLSAGTYNPFIYFRF